MLDQRLQAVEARTQFDILTLQLRNVLSVQTQRQQADGNRRQKSEAHHGSGFLAERDEQNLTAQTCNQRINSGRDGDSDESGRVGGEPGNWPARKERKFPRRR